MAASTANPPAPITIDTLTRLSPCAYLLQPSSTHPQSFLRTLHNHPLHLDGRPSPPHSKIPHSLHAPLPHLADPPPHLRRGRHRSPAAAQPTTTCPPLSPPSAPTPRVRCSPTRHPTAARASSANLAAAYRQATGAVVPLRGMVLDSAPAGWLRVLPGSVVVGVLLALWWVLRAFFRVREPVADAAGGLNDPGLIAGEAGRCYVYAETDGMVWWEDVEGHAREAGAKGWVVRREKFMGSGHVGHAVVDPGRYWEVVRAFLGGAGGGT